MPYDPLGHVPGCPACLADLPHHHDGGRWLPQCLHDDVCCAEEEATAAAATSVVMEAIRECRRAAR